MRRKSGMRAYTVHAPPGAPQSPDAFAFVKDGIAWPALFVPVLWILWHRMWLTLVLYVIFLLVLAWTELLVNENAATILAILGAILFAMEGNNIRRLSLNSRGWSEVGGSFGQDLEEAEIRFFESRDRADLPPDAAERREAIVRAAYPAPEHRERGDEPIFGLFPQPER